MKRKTVTVYASSGVKMSKSYFDAAYSLGASMARQGWIQCNGGGYGLMEACTDGARSEGGVVDCVTIHGFTGPHAKFRDVVKVHTLPQRRKAMYERADAFVSLPGGLGTLEELSEIASWRQLDFHFKCVVVLNTNAYYASLMQFIERGIEEHFIAPGMRHCMKVVDTVEEAIETIECYKAVRINKNEALSTVENHDDDDDDDCQSNHQHHHHSTL